MVLAALLIAACTQPESSPTPSPTPPLPTPTRTPTSMLILTPTVVPTPVRDSTPNTSAPTSRQVSRFVSLDDPVHIPSAGAAYLTDDELVLGLEWEGEAQAYPLRMVTYHHIVNDTVGGTPLLITF